MKRVVVAALASFLMVTGLTVLPEAVASATTTPNLVPWAQVDASPSGCTSACTASPPGGPGGAMAYDVASHQLIYVSSDGSSTWDWNGSAWLQVDDSTSPGCSNCPNSPPTRNTFGMAYDAASHAIIVFGGDDGNDTWAWNGSSWLQIADKGDAGCTTSCASSPPANIGTQMAYDASTSQVVMFGGGSGSYNFDYNDTWILTYHGGTTYTWVQADASTDRGCTNACILSPPDRNVATMAFDPATNQLVLFGGEETAEDANGQNDTWNWTGTSWQQVGDANGTHAGCGESLPTLDSCPNSPPPRVGASMTFDPAIGELVLFGGMTHYNNPEYDDTWAWNGSIWTHIDNGTDPSCVSSCVGGPSARDTFAMADDAATSQIILFGGTGNDTWAARAVAAPPSAPLHLKAVTKGTSVSVTWSAPTYIGATPVSKYKVTATPGNKVCITSTATKCVLSGLLASKRYTISVTAYNSKGSGPAATLRNVKG